MDYEHSADFFLWRPDWKIMPDVVRDQDIRQREKGCILKYSGIKEDVYVPDFTPDGSIRKQLGLDEGCIVVTVRPPATEAHYHNPESEVLFAAVMKRICETPGVCAVVLPRNKRQETAIRAAWPEYFRQRKAIIPEGVIDGLNLIWHSDLVVSGGGTMNREAAALGVPVYSIFRGPIGAVDRHLAAEGRLTLIESAEDVANVIVLTCRDAKRPDSLKRSRVLQEIIGHIERLVGAH